MSCENEHYHSHSHGDDGDEGHGHGHSHSHSHGHGHSHIAPIATHESQSLLSKIDLDHVTALNLENDPEELRQLFKSADKKYNLHPVIKSDADYELLIHIPFIDGSIKLFSLILRTNGDKHCPKSIKIFKNDKSMDFAEAEVKKPDFIIEHPQIGVMCNDEDHDIMPEKLITDDDFIEHYFPRHKFTGIHHLTIYIESKYSDEDEDEDDENVWLHYLELRGEFTALNKNPVVAIYEKAANPADHKVKSVLEDTNNFTLGN
ncbi:PITH domain-containing protein [Scheffersomyces amazonensis]|uniref:PITH domain-containing protein n=1 Tax=Scheffersomyces amazonensis TaxID=1078765 RepID=UPI00315D8C08